MNLGNLGDLIQQFTQSGDPEQFDKAAQSAPRSALAGGLASAFRAGETPPFPGMLTQLFKQSNGEQRAGFRRLSGGASLRCGAALAYRHNGASGARPSATSPIGP